VVAAVIDVSPPYQFCTRNCGEAERALERWRIFLKWVRSANLQPIVMVTPRLFQKIELRERPVLPASGARSRGVHTVLT
jgi:hypothetical protein